MADAEKDFASAARGRGCLFFSRDPESREKIDESVAKTYVIPDAKAFRDATLVFERMQVARELQLEQQNGKYQTTFRYLSPSMQQELCDQKFVVIYRPQKVYKFKVKWLPEAQTATDTQKHTKGTPAEQMD